MAEVTRQNARKVKFSKQEKKVQRKVNKYTTMVLNNEGINSSVFPTNIVVIGNAGLVVGIQRENIFDEFSDYGAIENIVMVPNQPYSFVKFLSSLDAENVVHNCHGVKPKYIPNLSELYIFYVDEIPAINPSNFGSIPPGLRIIDDFISAEDELCLLESIGIKSTNLKHRTVKHFGFEFLYSSNNVDSSKPLLNSPIPSFCNDLMKQALKLNYIDSMPDQLTVNQYLPGQGIPPHIDTHSAFTDEILSLSLGAEVVMDFVNQLTLDEIPVLVPRRSLLIMSGESRCCWSHGIKPHKTDIVPVSKGKGLTLLTRETRTSFTFRKLREGPCNCSKLNTVYNLKKESLPTKLDNGSLKSFEQIHVHEVYDQIAKHFSETRRKPWPRVDLFLQSLPPGSTVLDVGCGNGKYLVGYPSLIKIGTDRSEGLLKICSERGFEVFAAEMLALPVRSCIVDSCLCIAVIHHLASEERRIKAIEEISRVLCVNGQALIYVWALEQQRDNVKSNYIKKSRNRSLEDQESQHSETKEVQIPVHVNRTEFKENDMFVPWHSKTDSADSKILHRFYHLFSEGELEMLCSRVAGISVIQSYYDDGN
ncbi:Alkylated DNA repair protein alkB 8 [Nymphon striatum]|nr:Alkylated DNA repair protein alkB 8 [Nymphon striatum]